MKHLFIINPKAGKIKGRTDIITDEIRSFFASYQIPYDIHITRWRRDATGFTKRYVMAADELVRVHAIGGTGTLFEVANGVIGLSNAQVAAHAYGRNNSMPGYFGSGKIHLFSSIRNQVFSDTIPIDAIRCGNNYGLSHCLIGAEAVSGRDGTEMIKRTGLPTDFCYLYSVAKNLMDKNMGQHYDFLLDGQDLGGDYTTMMIANVPCYGKNMSPAVDAHPNDGKFEAYLIKDASRLKRLLIIPEYAFGNYRKFPDYIFHYSGSKITVSSENIMCISMDGETFYGNTAEFELIPYAIDFVCPAGIDLSKIPRVRTRTKKGVRHDK